MSDETNLTITSDQDLVLPSMQIIMKAGDGRKLVFAAGDAMAEGDYQRADQLISQGQTELREAHRVHTDCIQAAAVNAIPYSLLFTHAEDTLMTANSELRLMKKLCTVFATLNSRLAAVEAHIGKEASV